MARVHKYDPSAFVGTFLNKSAAPYSQSGLWIAWSDYHLVDHYVNEIAETWAIRTSAAIEDKTPLVKTFISGKDAVPFADHMQVRDATRIDVDHAYYTFYCDDAGHVASEGLTFRTGDEELVHMAGPLEEWLIDHAESYDVEIFDARDTDRDFAVLCVQGPRSPEVMKAVTGEAQEDLGFSRGRIVDINGYDVKVWRQGFTGEIGFELWVDPEAAEDMYSVFIERGRPHGAVPVGNAAQAIARVEAGMLIIGVDYRPAGPLAQVQFAYLDGDRYFHTPRELGFGRLVDFKRDTEFVGRGALEAEAARDRPGKAFRGLDIDASGIAALYERAGTPPFLTPRLHRSFKSEIMTAGVNSGFATSMCWSPALETMIGFAHIENPDVESGDDVTLTWQVYDGRGAVVHGEVPARIVDLPFVAMKRTKRG